LVGKLTADSVTEKVLSITIYKLPLDINVCINTPAELTEVEPKESADLLPDSSKVCPGKAGVK